MVIFICWVRKNSDQGILVYLALVVFFFISVCIAIFISGEPLEVAFGQREQVLPKDGTPSHTAVILVLMLFLFSVVFCVVLIYVIRKQNRKKGKILLEKINNQLKQNQDETWTGYDILVKTLVVRKSNVR